MARSGIAFARSIVFAAGVSLATLVGNVALAQAPSEAALERSRSVSNQINLMFQGGDAEGAHKRSMDMSKKFAAEGEVWLAASYAVAASEFDIRVGNAARIDAETYPRMQELLTTLDTYDPSRGDSLIDTLMLAKGILKQTEAQDSLGELYVGRIRARSGDMSEAELGARLRVAYGVLQFGDQERGYKQLKSALSAATMTDLHEFVMTNYMVNAHRFAQQGDRDKAEELLKAALSSKAANHNTSELSSAMTLYGEILGQKGRIAEASPILQRAGLVAKRVYGPNSVEFLDTQDKLSGALARNGFPASATNIAAITYQTALDHLPAEQSNWKWKLGNNYGETLRAIGAPAEALAIDRDVLEARAAHYGENSIQAFTTLNNLIRDNIMIGQHEDAAKLLVRQRNMAIQLDRENPGQAFVAETDAWILVNDVEGGSRKIDDEVVRQFRAIVPGHYANMMRVKAATIVAERHESKGEWAQGQELRQQALAIVVGTNGNSHPDAFEIRRGIARAKAAFDLPAAVIDFDTLSRDMRKWIATEINTAGNRVVLEAVRSLADDMLFDYGQVAARDPAAAAGFASAALQWKSLSDERRDRYARLADASGGKIRELSAAALRLANQLTEAMSSGAITEWSGRVRVRLDEIDAELTTLVKDRRELHPENLKPLPEAEQILAANEALVSYVITRSWGPDRRAADALQASTLYAVVTRKGETELFDLGDPRDIQKVGAEYQVASLRSGRSTQDRGAVAIVDLSTAFASLHARLIQPLGAALQGADTMFIVPDGALYAIPFSLLQDGQGNLIEDHYNLRMLSSPGALQSARFAQTLTKGTEALLVGGLDYSNGAERGADPLPGTLGEVKDIGALLSESGLKVETITGTDATETVVRKDAELSSIVHLATHGSYESERTGGAAGVDTLWQSGIILSNSGDRRSMTRDDQDGRLYAFELMDWDLTKLELLVLSACETGRGDESFVSGLRGLPTAVSISGAKRSLLALWPVDDAGTEQFMVRFYKHLVDGKTYPEALRQTKQDAINGDLPAAKDPTVWAAFVMFEN